MGDFNINQHKTKIAIYPLNKRAKLASGKTRKYKVYALRWRCPETGQKKQQSFKTRADAEQARDKLIAQIEGKKYFNPSANPTISEASQHWLDNLAPRVKPQTLKGYRSILSKINGPLLQGTPRERAIYAQTGEKPKDAKLLLMLGCEKVSALTTAQLRQWHNLLVEEVGHRTANHAMGILKQILNLTAEDWDIPVCKMPSNLARRKTRPRKQLLEQHEIQQLIDWAVNDPHDGPYVLFPWLTGVRVSEQLGLLWEDIDFEHNLIFIRRVQERNGTMTEATKTEAGFREIPMVPMLRKQLLEWKLVCPRLNGELYRVFPGRGTKRAWPQPNLNPGGPLLYTNFRKRIWDPALRKAGVPHVGHHTARHSFVSMLQATGTEVGLVSKLAGHANPSVTLGHYTQAVRGGAEAVLRLEDAYAPIKAGE